MITGKTRSLLLVFAILTQSGCHINKSNVKPASDPQVLQPFVTPDDASVSEGRKAAATEIQYYYATLSHAQKNRLDQSALENYRDASISLVNSYCRTWFAQLDAFSRNLLESRSNHGVLSSLGTALIGVGKLDADVTAVYGALNTAYTGAIDSAAKNYTFSASSTTVENRVFKHLNDRAAEIRANTPREFGQLRTLLEGYERICTFKHAAALVEQSVKSTESTVDVNGAIVEFSRDQYSDAIRFNWKPDGETINPEFQSFAYDWLMRQKMDVSLTSFIYGKPYAEARRGLLTEYAKHKKSAAKAIN